MDSLLRLQRFAGIYRPASWHQGYRRWRMNGARKIRNPNAYLLALQAVTPATIRQRQLEQRSTGIRTHPTKYEQVTYWALKHLNLPFRRQVVIGRYIADVILTTRNVVLEIDGESHKTSLRYDRARDKFLTDLGWHVLRVKTEEVSSERLRDVLDRLPTVSPKTIKKRIEYARAIERDRVMQQARSALRQLPKVETRSVGTPHADPSAVSETIRGQEFKQAVP